MHLFPHTVDFALSVLFGPVYVDTVFFIYLLPDDASQCSQHSQEWRSEDEPPSLALNLLLTSAEQPAVVFRYKFQ